MGYKGVVKNNVVVLEDGVQLPDGTEVEVITQGWWLSEEARRNALNKEAFQKWLSDCDKHRERMKKTKDSVQIIHELREERSNR